MKVGDEILIRVKVVGVNNNKYWSAIKVEVPGIAIIQESIPLAGMVKFSIPSKDQPKIIISKPDNEIVDQSVILNPR